MDVINRYRVDHERLRSAREEDGLTIAELASMAGMDVYQLALVEEQDYVPSLTTLRKLTLALGISAHTVIEWTPSTWYEAPDLQRDQIQAFMSMND